MDFKPPNLSKTLNENETDASTDNLTLLTNTDNACETDRVSTRETDGTLAELSVPTSGGTDETQVRRNSLPPTAHQAGDGTPETGRPINSPYIVEPYEPPSHQPSSSGRGNNRGRGTNRGRRRNQNNSNKIIPNYPPLLPETTDTKRFFILKGPEDTKLWMDINTISANQELIKALKGKPKRVSELRGGDILVEVANKEQSDRIRQMKKLDGRNISVSEHKTLNYTKGTIHSKRFCGLDEETLLAELAKDHVTEIYKIKRREGESLTNTGTMILTFAHFALPEKISIGWTIYDVREYIPNPRRCFKCQRYGHGSKACRSQDDRCANCGEFGHVDRNCSNPTNCCNCEEAHPSYSKKCKTYIREKEILTVMTKDKTSYLEAKKKLGFTTPPRRPYANANQNETVSSNLTTRTNQDEDPEPNEIDNRNERNISQTNNQLSPSTSGGITATKVAVAATKATTTIVAPKAAIAEGRSDVTTTKPKPSAPQPQIPSTPPMQKKQTESSTKRKESSSPAASSKKSAMEPPQKKPPPKDDKASKQSNGKPPPFSKMEVDAPPELPNPKYNKIPTTYTMRK